MTNEQEQLIQAAIYSLKNMHNFGTDKMQEVAAAQAIELRKLIKDTS